MSKIQLRTREADEINYVYVAKRSASVGPFFAPILFSNNILDFIRGSARSIRQLVDPINLYAENVLLDKNSGIWLDVVYEDQVDKYLAANASRAQVQLFFVDYSIKRAHKLVKKIHSNGLNKRYFYLFNGPNSTNPYHVNSVKSSAAFLARLVKDMGLSPSVDVIDGRDLLANHFAAAHNNFYTYTGIIGNLNIFNGDPSNSEEREAVFAKSAVESSLEANKLKRQESIINGISALDKIHKNHLLGGKYPWSSKSDSVAPLILIAPFYNPEFKNIFKAIRLNMLYAEQSINYNFEGLVLSGDPSKEGKLLLSVTKPRFKYLDGVAYLHSTFKYSPVMRLPIRGVSIYRQISFFGVRSNLQSHENIKQTMSDFSRAYKQHTLSEIAENMISERSGQIIAISDLPIEWIEINGVPLAFTHDVCRLPETSLPSLMASFATHSFTKYSAPNDLLKKTLVIFGASDEGFLPAQIQVENLSTMCGFVTRRCSTLKEVEDAVKEIKPELLVFDCHGEYEPESNITFLWIGDEKLTNEEVVKRQIQAPLVFLSACGTAPTFGTFKIIATAFLEAGALSVTSTYLPITISSGSYLYARVLTELAGELGQFGNWLSFICHIIRTSSIVECFDDIYSQDDEHTSRVDETRDSILRDVKHFENRRRIYHELDAIIHNANEKRGSRLMFTNKVPEYLYYSTIGRADLIHFAS